MALSRKMWKIFVIFLGIISIVNAGGDTLVLLDNLAIKETHSMFFKSLQGWFYHLQKSAGFTNIYILEFVFIFRGVYVDH